jgi:hypothetical protein
LEARGRDDRIAWVNAATLSMNVRGGRRGFVAR